MTTKKSSTFVLPLVVGGAALSALIAVLAMSNAGDLGTRYPAEATIAPGGVNPSARIVDQKYQCSTNCRCKVYDITTTPVPSPRHIWSTARWTSCVSVENELSNDARAACEKNCDALYDSDIEEGSYDSDRDMECKPIGDC
jgi:hypothetical protein